MKIHYLITFIILMLVYTPSIMADDDVVDQLQQTRINVINRNVNRLSQNVVGNRVLSGRKTSDPAITITSFHVSEMKLISQFNQTVLTGIITSANGLSMLTVDGTETDVDKKGLFSTTLDLDEGKNHIIIEAKDKNGKKADISIVINYKRLPPAEEVNHADSKSQQKITIISPTFVPTQDSKEIAIDNGRNWQVWALSIAGISAALAGTSALEYNKQVDDGNKEEAERYKNTYQLFDKITIVALLWEGYLLFSKKDKNRSVKFYPSVLPALNRSEPSMVATWQWMF